MDALAQDELRDAYGQAVWSCPPDAGVKPIEMRFRPCGRNAEINRRRRLTSPVLRGDHGAAVKPLRRECRTCFGLTCLSCVHFPFSHTSLRVRPAPGAPCALVFHEGQRRCKARTRNRAAGMLLHVLSSPSSFWDASRASEPGIHNHRLVWAKTIATTIPVHREITRYGFRARAERRAPE
jgi:hypothetical protein